MSSSAQIPSRGDVRRQQLLKVGFELFANSDYEEVPIHEIARQAGVSHGLVFQYFGSKSGFYTAVLENVMKDLRERLTPEADLTPIEQLRAGLRAQIDFAADHPRGYFSIFHRYRSFPEVHALLEESRRQNLVEVAEGMNADIDDPVTWVSLRAWSGAVDQALISWLEDPRMKTSIGKEALVDIMFAPLLSLGAIFRSDFNAQPDFNAGR